MLVSRRGIWSRAKGWTALRTLAPPGKELKRHMKSTVVEKAVATSCRRCASAMLPRTPSRLTAVISHEFSAYIGSRGWKQIDHVTIRGFLSHLYEKGLGKTSVARALAAVRSLYRWLAQEGVVEQNPAALVSTPKLAKKLPRVPTIEEMNDSPRWPDA